MRSIRSYITVSLSCIISFALCSCAQFSSPESVSIAPLSQSHVMATNYPSAPVSDYAARLPQRINTGEKTVLVDPNVHAWGAYDVDGKLISAGLATAGADWCDDVKRPCRTKAGSFRINSLGSASCKSSIYPLGKGGAPMPYCMFFNGHQGLHGSYNVVEGNVSHGCVRMEVEDAEWLRFNFASIGTKVIVKPY